MERYKCVICGYIYNPEEGDATSGIEPGTAFSDLPDNYLCPVCGAGKDEFLAYDGKLRITSDNRSQNI